MNNSLDAPPIINESGVSFTGTAVRYGLIGGLITVLYALVGIVTGMTNPSSGMVMSMIAGVVSFVIYIVIYIVVIVKGIGQHRDKELGGLISFGRAFLVGLIIALIMSLLEKLFNYVYFNYIDPAYLSNALEGLPDMYEEFGMDEAMIEASMEAVEKEFDSQKTLLGGLPTIGIMAAVVSAIIALIMKRKPSVD